MPKEYSDYIYNYTKNNYDRISVYFPKGMKEQLKTIAEKQGSSTNAIINMLVSEFIEQNTTEESKSQDTTSDE